MELALSLLIFPFFLLNFAGLVGGVWLLSLGQWKIVLWYCVGSLLGTFFLQVSLVPSTWLLERAEMLLLRGWRFPAWLLLNASIIWCAFTIGTWCFGVFSEVASLRELGPFLPYLLFGYGVTVGPWTYLASKNPDGSMLLLCFTMVGVVAMMVVREFSFGISLLLVFGLPLAIGLIVQIAIGSLALLSIPLKENRKHS